MAALPPPGGCGRSPPFLPWGVGERRALPGSLLAGVTFNLLHPSPTALTCYLARREDKSDAEGTLTEASTKFKRVCSKAQ